MIGDIDTLCKELAEGTLVEHRHTNVELKESWHQDHGKKISAQANKLGITSAWLVLGVRDNGTIVGRGESWVKTTEEELSQHINRYLDPIQTCKDIRPALISGSWVIIIHISQPGAVVYWNHRVFKGSGTTQVEMEPADIMALTVALPGLEDYSARKVSFDYDSTLVRRFAVHLQGMRDESHFFGLASLSPDEILNRLSIYGRNVARILFGNCPFRVVYYNSDGEPEKQVQKFGLYRLLERDFRVSIQQWTRDRLSQAGDPYPEKALIESLANAVAHSAYFEQDGDIIVEVFHDHLAISNLCLRESGFFANKWFSRSHKTVNKLLMETLRIARLVDELGRGKNVIFCESLSQGKRSPQVQVERAGRYSRWRLLIFDGTKDERQLKLLDRLRDHYGDEHKALIANALILWRGLPLKHVRGYVDGESSPAFSEVLKDRNGPIFYLEEEDRIIPTRWVRILLDEGRDSKQLTEVEELRLYELAYDIQNGSSPEFVGEFVYSAV